MAETRESESLGRKVDWLICDKIVAFIKSAAKGDMLYAVDQHGNRHELAVNGLKQLCYVVGGNNKKLIEGSGLHMCLDAESNEKLELRDQEIVREKEKPEVLPEIKGSSAIDQGVRNAIGEILSSGMSVSSSVKIEKPVEEKRIEVALEDRLKKILEIITRAHCGYKISYDYKKGCNSISSSGGFPAGDISLMRGMCDDFAYVDGELKLWLTLTREEERVAKLAGYKVSIVYG